MVIFTHPGRIWQQQPERVNAHDFPQEAVGRAVPYGIYELNHNRGYVYIGSSADTSELAVEAIALWWQTKGQETFPTAKKLLMAKTSVTQTLPKLNAWREQWDNLRI